MVNLVTCMVRDALTKLQYIQKEIAAGKNAAAVKR